MHLWFAEACLVCLGGYSALCGLLCCSRAWTFSHHREKMKSQVYQNTSHDNIRVSAGWSWGEAGHNNDKHPPNVSDPGQVWSGAITCRGRFCLSSCAECCECFLGVFNKGIKVGVLSWPSQSPDLWSQSWTIQDGRQTWLRSSSSVGRSQPKFQWTVVRSFWKET